MNAIILAAGYATRLGALTANTAKPLLPVAGKPIIEHIVEKILICPKVDTITVVTNDRFYGDFVSWAAGFGNKHIQICNDGTNTVQNRLGPIGDMAFVVEKNKLDDDLLIVGGDNLFDEDLRDFITFFEQHGSSIMLHDVKSLDVARQLGIVTLDDQFRIVKFEEKPQHPTSTLASTLIYAIRRQDVLYIHKALAEGFADRSGDFVKYLSERVPVFGKHLTGSWFDIGSAEQLEQASRKVMNNNITVFGTGYVGLVTGASLAAMGHKVLCYDIDANKIQRIELDEIPFYEPGLKDLVHKGREKGTLRFTTDLIEAVSFGGVIFNCVGTPSKDDGGADLQYVFAVARNVAQHAQGYKVLINKSTVPPGTAAACMSLIRGVNPAAQVDVVSNPEFLKEGSAVHDFSHPDKIVIGTPSIKAAQIVRRVYMGRVRAYIPVIETDWATAEMIKYANNSFLATKISFINEIANICDRTGADVKLVAQAMGLDYRISPKFLNPGVGYGGSCFPKDVKALAYTARQKNLDPVLLDAVHTLNENQKHVLIAKVVERFGKSLEGHTFSVWGLSFKPKTSDMRDAPSLVIIDDLLSLGARVVVYDPIAMHETKMIMGDKIVYAHSAEDCVIGSSGILLVTEWDEFWTMRFDEIGKKMKHQVLFDGRNIYEPELVREDGFEYYGIGRK
ncbi:nucleotide sugar dehydrogenase [Candidatus Woesearchaeota archaeon]|nr:nucleotide sugar dehydrogenase [Candidatus Woesearchaeota archaeon]